ncbi:MAG: hypothetical protein AAGI01_14965 [Myxococcota bacterium]
MAALEHRKEGRSDAALACCEAAAGYDPFVVETHYLIGFVLRDSGAVARTMEALRKVLFLDPMHWLGAFELARLYEDTQDVARARVMYRQALEGIERKRRPLFRVAAMARAFAHAEDHKAQVGQSCRVAIGRLEP